MGVLQNRLTNGRGISQALVHRRIRNRSPIAAMAYDTLHSCRHYAPALRGTKRWYFGDSAHSAYSRLDSSSHQVSVRFDLCDNSNTLHYRYTDSCKYSRQHGLGSRGLSVRRKYFSCGKSGLYWPVHIEPHTKSDRGLHTRPHAEYGPNDYGPGNCCHHNAFQRGQFAAITQSNYPF